MLVDLRGHPVGHQPRRLELRRKVSEPVLQGLEGADRAPKLAPLLDVGEDVVEGRWPMPSMVAARMRRSTLRPAISWVQPWSRLAERASSGASTSSRYRWAVSRPPMVSIGSIRRCAASVEPRSSIGPGACPRLWRCGRRRGCGERSERWSRDLLTPDHEAAVRALRGGRERATSEPASGSVIAIASTSPRAMPPSTSRFCSSVPKPRWRPRRSGWWRSRRSDQPGRGLVHGQALEHPAARAAVLLRDLTPSQPSPAIFGRCRRCGPPLPPRQLLARSRVPHSRRQKSRIASTK